MDWPIVVLIGILLTLGAIAVRRWLGQGTLDERTGIDRMPDPGTPATGPGARRTAVAVLPIDPDPAASPVPPAAPVPVAAAAAPAHVGTAVSSPDDAHPFGPASAASNADGSGPEGWTVKGNADSGLYHLPASPSWKRMHAGVWFETEEAAEAAGFKRWDWRRTAS
jgi:hypothetical protein